MAMRTRSIKFEDPSVIAAAAVGKSGLDFLKQLLAGTVPPMPVQLTLGAQLVEVEDGLSRWELLPGEHLYGAQGVVAAGVPAALLELSMSAAVQTTLDAATAATTVALTTHLTRAITTRIDKIRAEAWVVHRGSRLVTAEGQLTDETGRLFAHGSVTCSLAERPTR